MVESITAMAVKTNMKMSEVFLVRFTEKESMALSFSLESQESVGKYAYELWMFI